VVSLASLRFLVAEAEIINGFIHIVLGIDSAVHCGVALLFACPYILLDTAFGLIWISLGNDRSAHFRSV
jgi:hypothetical protein